MKKLMSFAIVLLLGGLLSCVPLGMARFRPDCPFSRADRVGFHIVELPIGPIGIADDWTERTAVFASFDAYAEWYEEKYDSLSEPLRTVFTDAYAPYEDNFFDGHGLAYVTLWLPSGSIVADVWRTYLTDDGILHVLIEELRPIDGMTEDMRSYVVAFEFDRDAAVVGVEVHLPEIG